MVTHSYLVESFTVTFSEPELHLGDPVLDNRQRWTSQLELVLTVTVIVFGRHAKFGFSVGLQQPILRVKLLEALLRLTLQKECCVLLRALVVHEAPIFLLDGGACLSLWVVEGGRRGDLVWKSAKSWLGNFLFVFLFLRIRLILFTFFIPCLRLQF